MGGCGDEMNFKRLSKNELDERRLPDSVYKSVVTSLYADPQSLAIGIFSCIAGALILLWKTGDPLQFLFAWLFLLFGVVRLFLSNSFTKATTQDISLKEYEVWENRYTLTSTFFIGVLGIWYAFGVYRSDDSYVQLLSLSLVLCYLIGVIGRNFASRKVVRAQVITSILFVVGTAVLFDDVYGVILTLFLLPFLAAIQFMSARLRGMLFRAEINSLNNKTIANRFDVALENVTHGIAMIDEKGVIVVANERFMEISGLDDWEIIGCEISMLNIIEIHGSQMASLGEQIAKCLEDNKSDNFTFTLGSGAIIEAEYNFMTDGGVIVLSDVSERKASEKVIKDLADYDPLTGLFNRRYFVETVEHKLKQQTNGLQSAMIFIDLDKFKQVNDTMGHAIGDELLRVVSARLQLILKEDCTICRFGGDEFVIFCPNIQVIDDVKKFAEIILNELKLPLIIRNNNIEIGCSIGIAMSPDHGTDANTLLQHADAALYESKANGRAKYTFFTEMLGEALRDKRELETDLRMALQNDEIQLYYQPIFDVKNCNISGCEALARWEHPVLGFVSPFKFITLAEETGLIVLLGENVLRKAMQDCLNWPDHMRVAVNVSSIQFAKTDVYKTIKRLLDETGLPASKFAIEVTESAMINNIDEIKATLQQISNLGVSISLDDFGTGFSSLSYLNALPFDKVKIDKSFVDNSIASERSLILLQGVVDLIRRLGLRIVLEGIETNEQLRLMEKNLNVHEYQGYLFFKPMKREDVQAIIEQLCAEKSETAELISFSKNH